MYRTQSIGHGIVLVYTKKDNSFICRLEKTKYKTWNILQSCTGYINYGYETKSEAVISAFSGKDYRKYKIGL